MLRLRQGTEIYRVAGNEAAVLALCSVGLEGMGCALLQHFQLLSGWFSWSARGEGWVWAADGETLMINTNGTLHISWQQPLLLRWCQVQPGDAKHSLGKWDQQVKLRKWQWLRRGERSGSQRRCGQGELSREKWEEFEGYWIRSVFRWSSGLWKGHSVL